ncbi:hypothetical protein CV102_15865 [Natronococcus pandeyae]|uniref:Uncharacterized protein n=1 Tax=Natronococcus pandeyae TaxID=2055836 RepID=A0A8J8TRB9_9EURY|nr:hypothetical protein CV102_15865 [Natronococcus pandeyae]
MFDIRSDPVNSVQLTVTSTGGNWPRDFRISPSSDSMYVCRQHSHDIKSFASDSDTGTFFKIALSTRLRPLFA